MAGQVGRNTTILLLRVLRKQENHGGVGILKINIETMKEGSGFSMMCLAECTYMTLRTQQNDRRNKIE